jgi:hypothetical protein
MFDLSHLAKAMGPLFLGTPHITQRLPQSTPRNPSPRISRPPFHVPYAVRQGGDGLAYGIGYNPLAQGLQMTNAHTP